MKRHHPPLTFSRLLVMALLAVGSLAFLLPFYMSLTMSLKTPSEISTTSAWSWARHPSLANYVEVLTNPNISFTRLFWNTLTIASMGTLGATISASIVAYAFARIRFPGRDRMFLVVLSSMMLPGIVTMIPSYLLFKELRWVNTALPLIVPQYFGGGAFFIFLLRQFFLGIPKELDEAARLDGAGHWVVFCRVVVPLSTSSIATVAVLNFIYSWRDFMGPLIYLDDVDRQTLELGLSTYNSLRAAQWHLLMAGSVMVTIPLIVLFFLGQRYFMKGITMSGGK